jgi:hypothetical protein
MEPSKRFMAVLSSLNFQVIKTGKEDGIPVIMGRLVPNTPEVRFRWHRAWEHLDRSLDEQDKPYASITIQRWIYSRTLLRRVFVWGIHIPRTPDGTFPFEEFSELLASAPKIVTEVNEVALVGGRSTRGSTGEMGKVAVGPMAARNARSYA